MDPHLRLGVSLNGLAPFSFGLDYNEGTMTNLREIHIAELEEFGCNIRIINRLENQLGILWLHQLLQLTPQQIENVRGLGAIQRKELVVAVKAHRAKHKW